MKINPEVKIIFHDNRVVEEPWELFSFEMSRVNYEIIVKTAQPQQFEPFAALVLREAVNDIMFKDINVDAEEDAVGDPVSIMIRLPSFVVSQLGVDPYRKAAKILSMACLFHHYSDMTWRGYCKKLIIPDDLLNEIKGRYGRYVIEKRSCEIVEFRSLGVKGNEEK